MHNDTYALWHLAGRLRKITSWPFSSHRQHSWRIIWTSGRTNTKLKILLLRATRDQAAALNTSRSYNTRFAGSWGWHIALPSPCTALLMSESNISTAENGVKFSRLAKTSRFQACTRLNQPNLTHTCDIFMGNWVDNTTTYRFELFGTVHGWAVCRCGEAEGLVICEQLIIG